MPVQRPPFAVTENPSNGPDSPGSEEEPAERADVDFVHRNPILASAVAWEWKRQTTTVALGGIHTSWSSLLLQDPLEAAPWVVLDAYADDLVPLPLKVRSLAAAGRQCIVLGQVTSPQRAALSAEGAVAILDPDSTAAEIPRRIESVLLGLTRALVPQPSVGRELTDREIQVLELYARRRALTASALAEALELRTTTVRGHLARGRRKLAEAGLRCATRGELAKALQDIGYSITDNQWQAVGRW
ncbi:hypothetical protein [Paenarthrobacter sp. NPDC058040]|uniref:helix-turn-helix transcriptional regulator n=1 Tax=unclassified Paenarthrobacter TaxID=2634190 RepID=UPI0036D997A9